MKWLSSSVLRVSCCFLSAVIFVSSLSVGLSVSAESLDNHDLSSDLDSLWGSVSDVIDEAPEESGAVDNTQIQEFSKQFDSVKEYYDEIEEKENTNPDSSKWYVDIDFGHEYNAYVATDYFSLNCVSTSFTEDNYLVLNFVGRAPNINIETFNYHHVSSLAYDYRINYQLVNNDNLFYFGFFYEGQAFWAKLPDSKSVSFIGTTFTNNVNEITLNSSNLSFYLSSGFNIWSSSDNKLILKGVDVLLENSDSDGYSPSYEYPDVEFKIGDLPDLDTTVKSEVEDDSYSDDVDFDNLSYPFPAAYYVAKNRNYPDFSDLNSRSKNEYYYCSDIFQDFEDENFNPAVDFCKYSYVSSNKNFAFFNRAMVYTGSPDLKHFTINLPLKLKGKGIRFAVKSSNYADYGHSPASFDLFLKSVDGSVSSQSTTVTLSGDEWRWVILKYSDLGITDDLIEKYNSIDFTITFESLTNTQTVYCFDEFHFFDVAPYDKILKYETYEQYYEGVYGNTDETKATWFYPDKKNSVSSTNFELHFKMDNSNSKDGLIKFNNSSGSGEVDYLKKNKNSRITRLDSVNCTFNLSHKLNISSKSSLTFGFSFDVFGLYGYDSKNNFSYLMLDDYLARYIHTITLISDYGVKSFYYDLSSKAIKLYSISKGNGSGMIQITLPNLPEIKQLSAVSIDFRHQSNINKNRGLFWSEAGLNSVCFSVTEPDTSIFDLGASFKKLLSWISDIWTSLISIPKNIYNYFSDPNTTFLQKIMGIPKATFEWFKGSFSQFLSFPTDIAKHCFSAFKTALSNILDFNRKLFNASVDFFKSLPGRIVEIFKAVIDIPKKVAEWIKSLFIPSQSQINKLVYTERTFLENNGGFVFQTPALLSRLFKSVTTTDQTAKLTFPKISLPMGKRNYTISKSHTLLFSNYFNSKLITAVRVIFSITLILSLLCFLIERGFKFFRSRSDDF